MNIYNVFCALIPGAMIVFCLTENRFRIKWFPKSVLLPLAFFPLCVGVLVAVYNIKNLPSREIGDALMAPISPADWAIAISNAIWAFEYGAWSIIVCLFVIIGQSIRNRDAIQTA